MVAQCSDAASRCAVASASIRASNPRIWGTCMAVTVATLRETAANERRVALTPEVAKKLKALGLNVDMKQSSSS